MYDIIAITTTSLDNKFISWELILQWNPSTIV